MNRIERLIWEETQVKEIERLRRESRCARGARITLRLILVAVIALVATQISFPSLNETTVQALLPASVFVAPAAFPGASVDAGSRP